MFSHVCLFNQDHDFFFKFLLHNTNEVWLHSRPQSFISAYRHAPYTRWAWRWAEIRYCVQGWCDSSLSKFPDTQCFLFAMHGKEFFFCNGTSINSIKKSKRPRAQATSCVELRQTSNRNKMAGTNKEQLNMLRFSLRLSFWCMWSSERSPLTSESRTRIAPSKNNHPNDNCKENSCRVKKKKIYDWTKFWLTPSTYEKDF